MSKSLTDDLSSLDSEELKKIALQLKALSQKEATDKPSTDDELHAWIKASLGYDIPREACCPEHDAPFDLLSDLFFYRVDAAILVAGRGGGKTLSAALWNFLNCYWIPEVECATVGAVEIQAKRAYAHLKHFNRVAEQRMGDNKVDSSLVSETIYTTGAKYEILTGSKASVNGPHPMKVHRDEVELMDPEVFQESLQMEKSKKVDGINIPSQTLITSTRKSSDGLMQKLLDSCLEAERMGRKAPYKVYTYCIKDVIENQPNCRVAFPDLPDEQKCDCNKIQNGKWADETDRTFEAVCDGLLSKSQGFVPLEDAQNTFLKSSKLVWEAQQECKRPYVEDVSLENFSKEKHGVRNFLPDPANGSIYVGIDFGGTSPHAVEWIQILDHEVEALSYKKDPIRLRQGSGIIFDEIYIAEIGNVKLAELIVETEKEWRRRFPRFRVSGRFADPQAKAARLDFAQNDPPLKCSWPTVTRDREEHLKRTRDLIDDGLFYVDIEKAPMFIEQVEVWNIDTAKKKDFDHSVDAALYAISNIYSLHKSRSKYSEDALPTVGKRGYAGQPDPFNDSIPGVKTSPTIGLPQGEEWRLNPLGNSIK